MSTMSFRARRLLALSTVTLLVGTGLALTAPIAASAATTLEVGPGKPYATIQRAIDAAREGDTVNVAAGNYRENVVIQKHITVRGANNAGNPSIIRSASSGSATVQILRQGYVPSTPTVLSGFTIVDGNAGEGHGGGITVFSSSPEISDNIIQGNHTSAYGGGIAIFSGSNPLIRNNLIQDNSATTSGGGIFVGDNSSPSIYGNKIYNNTTSGHTTAGGGSVGGGIFTVNGTNASSTPVILNNDIQGNTAEFAGGGIVVGRGANTVIEGNNINNNRSAYGGGIHMEAPNSNSRIISNTITNNTAIRATFGGGTGGGIALFDQSNTVIQGNTISGNKATIYGGGISSAESAVTTLTGNVISNNLIPDSRGTNRDGGGLYVTDSTLTATNNQFFGNEADHGGAIALLPKAKVVLNNNTIVRNTEYSIGGGALFVSDGVSQASAWNNILAQNSGYQVLDPSSIGSYSNNLLTSPRAAAGGESGLFFSYAARGLTTAAQVNNLSRADFNIDTDPGFVNDGGYDFSLKAESTAVNKGMATGYPTDYRGALRTTGQIDIGAFEYEASPVIPGHVYRFWNATRKGHFFTLGTAERNAVASTYIPTEWQYESIAYDAFSSQIAGTIPLYRFFSQVFQGHFYTASSAERDQVDSGYTDNEWLYEGVAYYVYPTSSPAPSRNVYRFWSPDNKHHFYTSSEAESLAVQNNYPDNVWTYEGPSFKVPNS